LTTFTPAFLPFKWLVGHSGGSTTPSTGLWSLAASRLFQDTRYAFPHYTLFEDVQAISNDGNPDAQPTSAFYMLHMAYDTAAPGGPSNTTDPTNCIVTIAGLPL
jgi:hypothetical protein